MNPCAAACIAAIALAGAARAEVTDSQANGFTVRQTLSIAAPAGKVWTAMSTPGAWWDPEHSYSHDGANMSLDLRPGGAWLERLPGGGVVHMTVLFVSPYKTLRLDGALGPLQGMGVVGRMTFTLAEAGGVTTLVNVYDAGGHAPGGLDKLAGPVDGVLGAQMRRLKAYIETGKPQ